MSIDLNLLFTVSGTEPEEITLLMCHQCTEAIGNINRIFFVFSRSGSTFLEPSIDSISGSGLVNREIELVGDN